MDAPPERGTFCRLKPKNLGISLVEVYERVGKAVRCEKGPKRADRRIVWLWGRQENRTGLVSTSHSVSGVRVGITLLLVQRIK